MSKLSKSAEKLEKRKTSEKEMNKKIIELYIRALIQLIPGVGGAIEKALFANIDAARQQDIDDLQAIIIEHLEESQIKIIQNSKNINEIVEVIQEDKAKFSNFIEKLSTLEFIGSELKLELNNINVKNDIKFSEVINRIEILEKESKVTRKMFVTAEEYFSNNGKHLLEVSISGITRFNDYIKSFESFISSFNNLLIISGKGGNGKTHLLKEINTADCKEYTVLFSNMGLRDVEKAIQDELDLNKKYILVIDDADRNLADLQMLIALVKAYSRNIKLILTSRPAGLNSINKYVYDASLIGDKTEIIIEDWSSDELVRLLEIAGVDKDKDELILIAKMYPNPFLITWIGRNIQNKTTLTIENIRDIFVGEIEKAANDSISHFITTPNDFLLDLALVIPFNEDDAELKSVLSEKYKTTVNKIGYVIDQLVTSGVLRRIGRSIRFNPDMKGDLFLFYNFEKDTSEVKQKELFEFWFKINPEKVLVNIQALSRYFNSPHILAFCTEFINEWIDRASVTNGYDRINNLKLLAYISHLVPDETLNLLFTYLEIKQSPTQKDDFFKFEPTSDDYGPIIISLGWKYEIRKQLLDLILLLQQNKIGGYDNYKPANIVVSLVSPLENTPFTIIKTLELLEKWLSDLSQDKIAIIESALNEVLAGSHKKSKSFINVFKMWEEVLVARDDVIEMREKAFQLLIKLFEMNSKDITSIALKISRDVGSSKMGRADLTKIPLKNRIGEEHSRLVDIIGAKIENEKSFSLLSEIEDLFLHWYASETNGTSKVVDYLINFPRSIEYLIFKLFTDPEKAIVDFDEINKKAPKTKKWDWMFENYFFKFKNSTDPLYNEIADKLNNKYTSSESLIDYLTDLENNISPHNPWNHPLIITEWFKLSKDKFFEIRKTPTLWNKMPERFKRELEIEFVKQSTEHLRFFANEILSDLTSIDTYKLSNFLDALSVTKVDIKEIIKWLNPIISTQKLELLQVISHRLFFIFRNLDENKTLCDIVTNILSPFDHNKLTLINTLSFSFDLLIKNRNSLTKNQLDSMKAISKKYLYDLSKLDYQTESILYFIFLDDVEGFVDFLVYRFKKERLNYRKYESIPVGGFHKLGIIINTMDKYKVFFNGVNTISKEISYGGIHLSDLYKNIIDLINESTGNQFIYEQLTDTINNNDYLSALALLPYLNDHNKYIDTILLVTNNAVSNGYKEEVIRIYSSLFNKKSFGFGIEDLNERKTFFQKLSSSVNPGLHKKIIMDQIENIDKELSWMTRDDDDYYNPRG